MIPPISGALVFHVIVDDFNRTFSIDGPAGPSGVRLHYEIQQIMRKQIKKLRDFDLRAESFEAALAEIKTRFPNHSFRNLGRSPRKIISSRT